MGCGGSKDDQPGSLTSPTFLALLPGDELCISYVDTSLPFEERRRALQQQYGFDIG